MSWTHLLWSILIATILLFFNLCVCARFHAYMYNFCAHCYTKLSYVTILYSMTFELDYISECLALTQNKQRQKKVPSNQFSLVQKMFSRLCHTMLLPSIQNMLCYQEDEKCRSSLLCLSGCEISLLILSVNHITYVTQSWACLAVCCVVTVVQFEETIRLKKFLFLMASLQC